MTHDNKMALKILGVLVLLAIAPVAFLLQTVEPERAEAQEESECTEVEYVDGYRDCVPTVIKFTKPDKCYQQVAEDADEIAMFVICENNIVIYYKDGRATVVQFKAVS